MFIKGMLGIGDIKQRFLQDQLGLLKHIIKLYVVRYPFQNITSFGQFRPVDRWPPGAKEMIDANFKGMGGLCGHNNVFLKLQMESLGYRIKFHQGEFIRTGIPNSHCTFSVRIPDHVSKSRSKDAPNSGSSGQNYLVDVGIGIPLHEPIPLDELPFTRRGGGFDFRYEWKNGDRSILQRVNLCGDAIIGAKPPDYISPQNYEVMMREADFAESKKPIEAVYTNPHSVFLHQGIYAFRYLSIDEDDQDFKAVCIRGKELIHITRETRNTEKFNSYAEMESTLTHYFPMIPLDQIKASIKHYDMRFEDALQLPSVRTRVEVQQ